MNRRCFLRFGRMTVAAVIDSVADRQRLNATMPDGLQMVYNAITELVGDRGGRLPGARSVGMRFRRFRQRIVDGKCLDFTSDKQGNLWYVRTVESGGTSDTMGTIPGYEKTAM